MYSEIPVSMITRNDEHIFYFDICHICNPSKIEAAYIKAKQNTYSEKFHEASVLINDYLSEEHLILLSKYKQPIQEDNYDYIILADASEAVKMIASKYVENKGFTLRNIKYIYDPRLVLCYYRDKIYPYGASNFFDKKICLSSYMCRLESPWFFSAMSNKITVFVCNNGTEDITVYLEKSPDAIKVAEDAQRIYVRPGQTIDIVPYKFSKFIRLVASSKKRKINCDVWFQTQLSGLL